MSSWKIDRVGETARVAALQQLFSADDVAHTTTQVAQALERIAADTAAARGLIVALPPTADRNMPAIGVCWLEGQAGNVAYLHPPVIDQKILPQVRERCALELYEAAEKAALDMGITWVQCLLDPGSAKSLLLPKLGYWKVSTLVYQAALLPRKNPASAPLRLKLRPYAASQRSQLEELLAATYEGSLDCPDLNGLRTPSATLQSYESIGQSGTLHWQFVYHEETLLGCLLLGTHAPETPKARPLGELIYWGVIPSERGQGYGREVLELALAQAEALNMDKLVLAVDQANEPALRQYAQCGFFEWLRKEAWGKQLRR
jgi:mycothiol synthase